MCGECSTAREASGAGGNLNRTAACLVIVTLVGGGRAAQIR
jgi:hypothetical protein